MFVIGNSDRCIFYLFLAVLRKDYGLSGTLETGSESGWVQRGVGVLASRLREVNGANRLEERRSEGGSRPRIFSPRRADQIHDSQTTVATHYDSIHTLRLQSLKKQWYFLSDSLVLSPKILNPPGWS